MGARMAMEKCSSYHTETGEARCWGTREMDPCSCGGDQRECSFYPEVRERAERECLEMLRKELKDGDYISREAAIKEIYRFDDYLDDDMEWRLHYALKKLPAADVVEVVRCRDCKYRAEDDFCTGRGWPMQLVADGGFCEKGERKDGGQDE